MECRECDTPIGNGLGLCWLCERITPVPRVTGAVRIPSFE